MSAAVFGAEDLATDGQGFDSGRDVDDGTHDAVLDPAQRSHVADDRRARADRGTHLHRRPPARPVRVVPRDPRALRFDRARHRALRVIRVGTERTEDGEDGVAQEIDHEASVLRDDAHE